ncbi:hypothetical protein LEP1GSC073_3624 [Leptospira noguchii str. Cascata]|nr:hypothetical protein LEP1GSC072_1003 [Leptospira noguchii str. Bonito]EMS86733.1 hypothetical protein LEP1GSC073_3624 [Leptospira noguchii str. Cascata]
MLGGGRISNTPDLLAGTQVYVSEGSNIIPKNVPPGNYYLCAKVLIFTFYENFLLLGLKQKLKFKH